MSIYKLAPYMKQTIWGGQTLRQYGKIAPQLENIAECWELSFHNEGQSIIVNGDKAGKKVTEVISKEEIGVLPGKFPFFPTLIKLIDADGDLSIQVHPSDEYALKNENSYGKTEMWYIISAKPGAGIYIGFNKDTSPDEVKERIDDNTLADILNFVPVKPGDCFFVKSGTVHAIGKGITLFEVQQNSNITYRLYDWGKLDKNGKPRELHVEKALKVINYQKYIPDFKKNTLLGKCDYFTTYEYVNETETLIKAPNDSFASITIIEGKGTLEDLDFCQGDTFFIPCSEKALLKGKCKYLLTQLEK